jgi:phosphohistidine swiveling domain-containing protein
MKSLRADTRQFLNVVVNRIIDRLADQWKVEAKLLETLDANIIINVLSGKSRLPQDLSKRWQHSILVPEGLDTYNVISGDGVESFLEQHLLIEEMEPAAEIKGQIAQGGKVTGKVKIVFGPQHLSKVNEADILVSPATSPQLLPAMRKAAAFVTDVGGITSHAAIVSRELKKPCIVGTQIATQVLQDGDEVEVDADEGVVRIIKKARE